MGVPSLLHFAPAFFHHGDHLRDVRVAGAFQLDSPASGFHVEAVGAEGLGAAVAVGNMHRVATPEAQVVSQHHRLAVFVSDALRNTNKSGVGTNIQAKHTSVYTDRGAINTTQNFNEHRLICMLLIT